jgi:hypothetical protein
MRKLPDDPIKRRRQFFKRIYQQRERFIAALEAGYFSLPLIITIPESGEEIGFDDLMVGIDSLPPQQRKAFELICLAEWTETDATAVILPESQWSTPVQQYADTALDRMIKAYDDYQESGMKPAPYKDRKKKSDDRE